MTGVLLIDKPSGPTSHDVVARLRQVTRERSIGHAGTLDPRATGLLVMLLGKATRIATLLSGHDKTYEAVVRLGWMTTTDDAAGERVDGSDGPLPSDLLRDVTYLTPNESEAERLTGIAVNPGYTNTNLVKKAMDELGPAAAEFATALTNAIPAGRLAEPHEIARPILFLASDDASYMYGSELIVDGG